MNLRNSKPLDKWFRGGQWGVKPLGENTREYSAVHFAWFDFTLKYRLIDLEPEASHPYNPLAETPKAYLRFIRLAEFERFRWDAKRCIKEVLSFFKDSGPLWYPGGGCTDDRLPHEPPPLTVERVLGASLEMASVVELYKLLRDVEEYKYNEQVPKLKEHMLKLQKRGWTYLTQSHLATTMEGLRVPVFVPGKENEDFKFPSLNNDREVIAAAIAYVIAGVNCGLGENPVHLALANQEGRNIQYKDVSQIGAWVPAYQYDSLLAALWVQFYLAILDKTRLKECANERCLRLFPPSRSDQEYCSSNCRAAYNMRRRYRSR